MSQNIRITMTSHGRGEVFLDGSKVHGVVGVSFSASAREGDRNRVTLDFAPTTLDIDGAVDITDMGSSEREFVSTRNDVLKRIEAGIERIVQATLAVTPRSMKAVTRAGRKP